MKSMTLIAVICSILITDIHCATKRPKKEKPKQNTSQKIDSSEEDEESHGYHPNPVILAGVGQIMNGALNIAQDPHSRPNIGHSVANIIHGIMKIIIEKVAHKNITINNIEELENCFEEVYSDITKKIIEIIDSEKFSPTDIAIEKHELF